MGILLANPITKFMGWIMNGIYELLYFIGIKNVGLNIILSTILFTIIVYTFIAYSFFLYKSSVFCIFYTCASSD